MVRAAHIADKDQETIIAQCTPKGSGAIALLRLSGSDAITIATTISSLALGKKLSELSSHTIHFGYVIDQHGYHIDQVMFLLMHGPKTFTGQHVVEITCHNNPFIIEEIIQQALSNGARMAQEGEFAKRAYLNNKIDLIQAEAINELIHANTQQALKKSMSQLEGSFSHHITKLEDDLYKALALSEASFEFLDEEMEFGPHIEAIVHAILTTITHLKKSFDQQQQIRQGIRIALVGAVNAGKSSLFNALLGKERAIVTNIAGTTRDVIEAGMYKDGNYWTLIDTAGLRKTEDVIEQEGIKRSHYEAQLADIVLLVYDSSREITQNEQDVYTIITNQHAHKVIVIHNKADLPSHTCLNTPESIPVIASSTKDSSSINLVEQIIQEKITALLQNADAPFLLNQRQFNLLLGLEKQLIQLVPMLKSNVQYELISYHLREALEHIAELTGKTVSERGMDTVFREFCIGK